MSYNKNTNWDNERRYLENLAKTGNAGEQAWANNQMNVLANAQAQYGGVSSVPTTTPVTPTPAGSEYVPIGTYNDSQLRDQCMISHVIGA